MSFYALLEQEYAPLQEQQVMSLRQRQKVAAMRRNGWDIEDREDDTVRMSKGDKGLVVYSDGNTTYVSESEEVDITETTNALLQEDDLLVEGVVDDVVAKIKKIAENATMVTLRRGSTAFIVTMGEQNEYTRIDNGTPVDSGTLANRRTAEDLVFRLEQSGFRETKFSSVVPRAITKTTRFTLRQAPFIALMFILYSFLPAPIAGLINAIFKGAWMLLSNMIMSLLPLDSLQALSAEVDEVLSSVGKIIPTPMEDIPMVDDVDGMTGAY